MIVVVVVLVVGVILVVCTTGFKTITGDFPKCHFESGYFHQNKPFITTLGSFKLKGKAKTETINTQMSTIPTRPNLKSISNTPECL